MNPNSPRALSIVVGFALVATLALLSRDSVSAKAPDSNEGPTVKVLIVNANPGDVISAGQVILGPAAALDQTTPEGGLLQSVAQVPDSGQVEIFVPVMLPYAIYVWSQNGGYHSLGNVVAGEGDTQIMLDASKAR